ncbi:MAG: sigma-70 family RNA polymerase sigma factor, partial [Bacteroidota bacterium]
TFMTQSVATIAWDDLYHELVSFVHRKTKDKATAEDIVQDVFVKVHTRAGQLKEAEKISAWIYQITRNAVVDHFRSVSRTVAPVNVRWEEDQQDFNDCVATCLTKLMTTLPEKYRIPLELTEIQNLSQYELAERLNITYAGARSRVQRARKMLRDKLDALYVVKTDAYGNVIVCEDRTPRCCKNDC